MTTKTKAQIQREAQAKINEIIEKEIEEMVVPHIANPKDAGGYTHYWVNGNGEKLYNCNAKMYPFDDIVILESYSTVIAVYDYRTEIVYDFLRKVYGYTATSCQHINKFARYMNAKNILTWREV